MVMPTKQEMSKIVRSLGILTELGTDTGWTFEPHPPEYGRRVLREAGWDEKTPILVLCPIHPFHWPVKASIAKFLARVTTGAYKRSQYHSLYFFQSGADVDPRPDRYPSPFAT